MCSHSFSNPRSKNLGSTVSRENNLGDFEDGKTTFPCMIGMKQPETSYCLLIVVCFCNPPLACFKVLVAGQLKGKCGELEWKGKQQFEGDAEEISSYNFFLWAQCS
jgi:hypothetical protein